MREYLLIALTAIICIGINNIVQACHEDDVPTRVGVFGFIQVIIAFVGLIAVCSSNMMPI